MNIIETKILVLIRNKNTGAWKDVTLEHKKHEYLNGVIFLTFNNGKKYPFSKYDFFYL